MKNYPLFFLLGGLLICAFLADIAIGSVNLSLSDVWATLTGNSDNLIYHEIILNHRLPKAITAICPQPTEDRLPNVQVMNSFSVSGLLMLCRILTIAPAK